MRYIPSKTSDIAIEHAVKTLSLHLLSGERVAWFLSGGSAIELEVRIAQSLQGLDISRLYVGMVDERYGPVGHKDENYVQLLEALFPFHVTRVLRGTTGTETAAAFGRETVRALDEADYSLGIFGIGTDGHTAGIKPSSPSTASTEPAVFYEWDDHKRITITPPTIRRLDETIIYAYGSEKKETLRNLASKDVPIDVQPAQILKEVKLSTLYTDNVL